MPFELRIAPTSFPSTTSAISWGSSSWTRPTVSAMVWRCWLPSHICNATQPGEVHTCTAWRPCSGGTKTSPASSAGPWATNPASARIGRPAAIGSERATRAALCSSRVVRPTVMPPSSWAMGGTRPATLSAPCTPTQKDAWRSRRPRRDLSSCASTAMRWETATAPCICSTTSSTRRSTPPCREVSFGISWTRASELHENRSHVAWRTTTSRGTLGMVATSEAHPEQRTNGSVAMDWSTRTAGRSPQWRSANTSCSL
mmetsp:Transcript_128394/g.411546  ORF Transcript_128394/g.411546 Transcript_128394/m.411546 type:complete len:257 (+) Transcript_128394:1537-2307(+)